MIGKQQITNLAEESIKGTDRFLVSVAVNSGNKISVIIDSDSSVNIDDCIQLSRAIESNFDRDIEDFELNVSSAGIDQPLKLARQYKKNINKEISVLKEDGKKLKGILKEIHEDHLNLLIPANKKKKTKEQLIEILFSNIKETKGIISFKK
jgi:ribosome maturation factor RimP